MLKQKFGNTLSSFRGLCNDRGGGEQSFERWLRFAENNELGPKGVLSAMIPPDAVDFQDLQKSVKDKAVTYASFRETVLQQLL